MALQKLFISDGEPFLISLALCVCVWMCIYELPKMINFQIMMSVCRLNLKNKLTKNLQNKQEEMDLRCYEFILRSSTLYNTRVE